MKRIATNAVALAIGGIVAQLAFVSIEVVIARHLGSADYGVFSTVYVLALTSLFVVDLGMTWRVIESGSREPATIPELLGTTIVLKIIGFALLYPIALLILEALGYSDRTVAFFLVFFLYALALSIQDSVAAVYTARQRMVVNAVVQGGTPLVIALFVTIALVSGLGLEGVGIGYVAGGLLITGAWAVSTWRREHARVHLAETGPILRGSVLYGLTGLLSQVFYKADVLLLSALATMPQVGIYAAGYKLLDLAYKIPILGARVVSPALFQQNDRDTARYRSSADAYLRLSTVAGLVLGVACYPSADWLVALLFGDAFAQAGIVLRILCASFALKFLKATLQTILTTRGQHRMRTGVLAAVTAAGVVSHLALIPRYGAVGAAMTVVGMEAALALVYLIGIGDTVLRGLLAARVSIAVAAAVAATALPLVVGLRGPAASAAGVLAFALVLFATGYVRRDEIGRLWDGLARRHHSRPAAQ